MHLPSPLKTISSILLGAMTAWALFSFSPAPIAFAQTPSCTPLPQDAVHWWKGDGDAQDSIGLNHGTLTNGASTGSGFINHAFSLDGIDDFVAVGKGIDLSDRFTVETWLNVHAVAGTRSPVYYNDVNGGEFMLGVNANLTPVLQVKIGNFWYEAISAIPLPDDTWHHVAGTFDSATGEVKMYVDGSLQDSVSTPASPLHRQDGFPGSIGAYAQNAYGNSEFFYGLIDELTLYRRALTASEILTLAQAQNDGKCAPASPLVEYVDIVSDTTWKASPLEEPGWETLAFDDSSWGLSLSPNTGDECQEFPPFPGDPIHDMWTQEQQQFAYFRKSFTLATTYGIFSAFLTTVSDDDHDLYVNGQLVAGEHTGTAGPALTTDIQPYLQAGDNIIAIKGDDAFGGCRAIGVKGTITLYAQPAPPLPSNHAPALSHSQDSGYLTDGINPDKGTANLTPLTFKAIYTDQDNDPPQNFTLHIGTGTINLDPIPLAPDTADTVPPALKDGNFTNGEQYAYTGTFSKGQYQYHFEVSDGEESTRLPSTGALSFQTGYSNIAFLPGIKASKLYKTDEDPGCLVNCENQLWNPNRNEDVEKLFLDDNGKSENQAIYTRDIIDTVIPYAYDIYRTFTDSLDGLDAEGIQWKALPYDWRLDFTDVVDGGIVSGNGNINYNTGAAHPYLIDEIEKLANQSMNGKVTIVSHSMGGLVAKTLLQKLEAMKAAGESDLIDKIDRLILVASPQLGTPRAVAALLHGDDEELCKIGICLIKQDTAREFGERMPSAYSLLPSSEYFQRVESPVVEFDIEVNRIYGFPHIYGFEIKTLDDFYKFLRGDDGVRQEPGANDTDSPNVVRSNLLSQAQATHAALDAWVPPSNIEVFQIAGWGLDTIRGVRYDDCDIPFCPQTLSHLDRELLVTEDGDGTVVSPSAVAMNARKFYVDMLAYNADNLVNRNHAGIFEVDGVQELIKRIVKNNLDLNSLPTHIELVKPIPVNTKKKLHLRALSPISIDIYDTFGKHTGLVPNTDPQLFEMQIPNSYYYKIGEKTYLGLDTRDQYRIEIAGLALGSFTLEIDEVFNDEVVDTTAFTNIPVTPDTKAILTTQTVDTTSSLTLDIQGDGSPDMTISPSETPDPQASLKVLKSIVNTLSIQKGLKNGIIRQIEAAEKLIDRRLLKAADGILNGLIKQLQNYPKFLINSPDAQALTQIIETIRLSLVQ